MQNLGKCLMIKTKDQREFFTYIKNYKQLVEFSKVFNAEISVVKVKDAEILELTDLAPALCDKNYTSNADYKVVDVKVRQEKKIRQKILENASKIKAYIKKEFLSGKIVKLNDLRKRFSKNNLTAACICNHLKDVKLKLEIEGYRVLHVGHGRYKLNL